jgi:hypothetical protein
LCTLKSFPKKETFTLLSKAVFIVAKASYSPETFAIVILVFNVPVLSKLNPVPIFIPSTSSLISIPFPLVILNTPELLIVKPFPICTMPEICLDAIGRVGVPYVQLVPFQTNVTFVEEEEGLSLLLRAFKRFPFGIKYPELNVISKVPFYVRVC